MKQLELKGGVFAHNPKLVKFIIIHCSATPRGRDIGALEIRQWHLARGFKDIGYHFVVRLNGTIETGRLLGEPGAHCLGQNYCSIGVCYVGGVEKDCKTAADTRTDAQKVALARLVRQLKRMFPYAEVRGHRDFARKACPSFDARREYSGAVVAPFAIGLCALTSCKSHKKTVSENLDNLIEVADVQQKDVVTTLFQDSVNLLIDHPVLEIHRPDSVRITIKARKVSGNRRTSATTEAHTIKDVRQTTTETRQSETRFSSDKQPSVGAPVGWLIMTLVALVAIVAWLRKFGKK